MTKEYEFGIIGMGPAGIGVAISLTEHGYASKTICFEQGTKSNAFCLSAESAKCCNNDTCSIISGIGGASNTSSGKLSNYPAGSGLQYFFSLNRELQLALNKALDYLKAKVRLTKFEISGIQIEHAKEYFKEKGLTFKFYDVYEFEEAEYRKFITDTITSMEQRGLSVLQNSKVIKIEKDLFNDCFSVRYCTNTQEECVLIRKLVIATGSFNIDDHLISELENTDKFSFEIGIRVEAPSFTLGTGFNSHGDLKLKSSNGRTYCVTENGNVIPYKSGGCLFLEGCKSLDKATAFTNFAVLIKRDNSEDFHEFLNRYKNSFNGNPIKQSYSDYINGGNENRSIYTTCSAAQIGDINKLFPEKINSDIKSFLFKIINSLVLPIEQLTIIAPELKLLRSISLSKEYEAKENLFIVGAATGKFRGILQSFCSGMSCGDILARR